MPLHLVPPGQRIKYCEGKAYPNRFYLVRGQIGGRDIEVSTKTGDPDKAAAYKARIELDYLERRVPGPGEAVTFAQATDFYIAFRQPSKGDKTRIRRVAAAIGDKLVSEVQQADLVAAADTIFPGKRNETKNRWVLKPGAAILHYAAENKWCDWVRVRKLSEAAPTTRASTAETARTLIMALEQEQAAATTAHMYRLAYKKRLLILWLYKHGNRISDPLRLRWDDHIFLVRKVYLLYVGKGNKWKEKPIDGEVCEALANDPHKDGYVFPWRTRSGVYKWLRPLTRKLKVSFTPHMARHYLGKRLNAAGEGLKTIMGALDQTDPHSAMRYQDADMEIVRRALRRSGKLLGKDRKSG
jgi:integrase